MLHCHHLVQHLNIQSARDLNHHMCCSVLQRVAACCSGLHRVLQCVAVCCSVVQHLNIKGARDLNHHVTHPPSRTMYQDSLPASQLPQFE